MITIGGRPFRGGYAGQTPLAAVAVGNRVVWTASEPPGPPIENHGTISYFWYDDDMHLLATEYEGSTERDTDYTWTPATKTLDVPTPPDNETVEWASQE